MTSWRRLGGVGRPRAAAPGQQQTPGGQTAGPSGGKSWRPTADGRHDDALREPVTRTRTALGNADTQGTRCGCYTLILAKRPRYYTLNLAKWQRLHNHIYYTYTTRPDLIHERVSDPGSELQHLLHFYPAGGRSTKRVRPGLSGKVSVLTTCWLWWRPRRATSWWCWSLATPGRSACSGRSARHAATA